MVRDSSKMNLVLEFPAADAAPFSVGQTAQVTLDGSFFECCPAPLPLTGTDATEHGQPAHPHCDPLRVHAGGLTHGTGCNGYYHRKLHCGSFQYQAERTLAALASGTVTAINVRAAAA